jgi:hypothetical protein
LRNPRLAVLVSACFLPVAASGANAQPALVAPFETQSELSPRNKIDEIVFSHWKELGIKPANLCSDSVFLRRVYLDTTGTLPTSQQVVEFLDSKDPNKRAALVDQLLATDEYASYWAMKWSDLLRVKAEFPINLWPNAAQTYYHWILDSVRANKPYDQFARELLTESGSNFKVPPVNFYRAMQNREPAGIAQSVALTLMGSRAEKWPSDRQGQMASFFSQLDYKHSDEWKEEIVFFNSEKPAPVKLVFPDGTPAQLRPNQDPREAFANWLISPKNPWFARNIVNRAWFWLMGRGIIQEPDDIRSDNPPENPQLLALLENELVSSHYDVKHLFRLILNSTTYQLSSIPQDDRTRAADHFAAYPLRRLDAEVLIDALCQITGTSETYTSAIPEPYTFMPDFQRAVELPDGSISSSFLELFGRPSRDTGMESERNNRMSDAQGLFILNSSQVMRRIQQGPKIQALMRNRNPRNMVTQIYLTMLSRYPTDGELQMISSFSQTGSARIQPAAGPGRGQSAQLSFGRGQNPMTDLIWVLLNSTEFLYRH